MISLIKKIVNSELIIKLRNSIQLSPVDLSLNNINFSSVSDSFLWRTDNNFITKINFIDILNLYYGETNTDANIYFYDKKFKLIKSLELKKLKKINTLILDKSFFENLESYGTFYIFHKSSNKTKTKIISNRCYVGFSKNNNHFSFLHGNLLSRFKSLDGNSEIKGDIIKTSLFMNQNYKIQKYFNKKYQNEIFLSNPTSTKINFSIEQKKYSLLKGESIIIKLTSSVVNIKSNCLFFRPIVFCYNKDYFDVHHG